MLISTVLVLGLVGYVLAQVAYFDLPPLPSLAPVSLLLLTILEGSLAKVVRDRVRDKVRRKVGAARPMHPIQVARAAVLAKASSLGGAVLLGLYGGIFGWTFLRRSTYATAGDDALVAGLSALTALTLVVAALLLERSCRTPDSPQVPPKVTA